jgi:hypothetical protein
MTDGLTADDVVYSINKARRAGPYVNRLNCFPMCFPKGLVKITFVRPNMHCPRCLTYRFMKSGTGDDGIPDGRVPICTGRPPITGF